MAQWGKFKGEVKTVWKVHYGQDRNMQLIDIFRYIDPEGREWTAEGEHEGGAYEIDGASIPQIFWSAIGSPYIGNYRRAAVLHDAGYKKKVDGVKKKASRKEVDKMFYHAMRCDEVDWLTASLFYVSVRLGGGSIWDKTRSVFVVTPENRSDIEEIEKELIEKGELKFDQLEKYADDKIRNHGVCD